MKKIVKKIVLFVMVLSIFLTQNTIGVTIGENLFTEEEQRALTKVLAILEYYEYKVNYKIDIKKVMENELTAKKMMKEFNQKFKEMEYYIMNEYVKIEDEINGWVIDDIGQEVAYEYAKGNLIKYILYLGMQYMEGARNNDHAINYNTNGTIDVGRTQQNCRIDDIEKIEKMKNPKTNLRNGFYEINEILDETDYNYAETMISYNGGYMQKDFIKCGFWTVNCMSGRYMQKYYNIVEQLFEAYKREVNYEKNAKEMIKKINDKYNKK